MQKQNKWIAVLISFFMPPLGMLYLAKIKLALLYFFVASAIDITELYFHFFEGVYWLEYFTFNYILVFVCAFHAFKIANSLEPSSLRPWYSKWYGLTSISLVFLSFVLSAVFLFRSFFVTTHRVQYNII